MTMTMHDAGIRFGMIVRTADQIARRARPIEEARAIEDALRSFCRDASRIQSVVAMQFLSTPPSDPTLAVVLRAIFGVMYKCIEELDGAEHGSADKFFGGTVEGMFGSARNAKAPPADGGAS